MSVQQELLDVSAEIIDREKIFVPVTEGILPHVRWANAGQHSRFVPGLMLLAMSRGFSFDPRCMQYMERPDYPAPVGMVGLNDSFRVIDPRQLAIAA